MYYAAALVRILQSPGGNHSFFPFSAVYVIPSETTNSLFIPKLPNITCYPTMFKKKRLFYSLINVVFIEKNWYSNVVVTYYVPIEYTFSEKIKL